MTDPRIASLIEQAFDYRGYVTLSRRDGSRLVGFVYDRTPQHVELFDEKASHRLRISCDDIVDIELSGEDAAAKAHRIWERRKGTLEPRETSSWGDWAGTRPALIVVALPLELRAVARGLAAPAHTIVTEPSPLLGWVERQPETAFGNGTAVAVAIGVGGGVARAIKAERPRLVISCGFSGALDPSLASGDIVIAHSVRDENHESLPVAPPLVQALRTAFATSPRRVVEGDLVCTSRVAATRIEKVRLAKYGGAAVDLESWSVARAAEQAGIPWLAVRIVLDPFELDLPPFAREPHASYVGPALRYAVHGPAAVVSLVRLAWRARTATKALEYALHVLRTAELPT